MYICTMHRVKKVLKQKGKIVLDLGDCLGITRESTYSRLKDPKLSTLIEVAKCLDCEVAELIETSDDYAHFYDENGEWLGIRKK